MPCDMSLFPRLCHSENLSETRCFLKKARLSFFLKNRYRLIGVALFPQKTLLYLKRCFIFRPRHDNKISSLYQSFWNSKYIRHVFILLINTPEGTMSPRIYIITKNQFTQTARIDPVHLFQSDARRNYCVGAPSAHLPRLETLLSPRQGAPHISHATAQ